MTQRNNSRDFSHDHPCSRPQDDRLAALAQIFTEARTHNGFIDKPVRMSCCRRRSNWPRSGRPAPINRQCASSSCDRRPPRNGFGRPFPGNLDKTMSAPVVAITGYDEQFYEHLPFLFPHGTPSRGSPATPSCRPQRVPERNLAGRLSHHRAARGRSRHWTDDRVRQREGRRRILSRGTREVERADQHRLWRREKLFPRSPRFSFDQIAKIL